MLQAHQGVSRALAEQYTRREVTRMLGVTEHQLHYWERLRLVRPQARWGERFYSFNDLLSLRTIQQLTASRIPAFRLQRAIRALEAQTGQSPASLAAMRALALGRDVVLIPPPPDDRPLAPLKRQFVLRFLAEPRSKVRQMASRTAEQWFALGMELEANPESAEQAAEAYRRAVELAPDWTEAQMNLGTVLYQLNRLAEAEAAFRAVLQLEPENPNAHLNVGCLLYELGKLEESIRYLREAVRLAPRYADAYLNLALSCEKHGDEREARQHWQTYLRLEAEGPWADYARSRVGRPRRLPASPKTIPFPQSENSSQV